MCGLEREDLQESSVFFSLSGMLNLSLSDPKLMLSGRYDPYLVEIGRRLKGSVVVVTLVRKS